MLNIMPYIQRLSLILAALTQLTNAAITIISPSDQATLQHPAELSIHFRNTEIAERYTLIMDGHALQSCDRCKKFSIAYPDRGTHTLMIQAATATGGMITSPSITVYIHQPSLLHHTH